MTPTSQDRRTTEGCPSAHLASQIGEAACPEQHSWWVAGHGQGWHLGPLTASPGPFLSRWPPLSEGRNRFGGGETVVPRAHGSLTGFAGQTSLACHSSVRVPPWHGGAAARIVCATVIAEPDFESASASHPGAQALDSSAPQSVECPRAVRPRHKEAILFSLHPTPPGRGHGDWLLSHRGADGWGPGPWVWGVRDSEAKMVGVWGRWSGLRTCHRPSCIGGPSPRLM